MLGGEKKTVSYKAAQRIVAAELQAQDAAHHAAHTSPADGTAWTRRMFDERQRELLAELAEFSFLDTAAATRIRYDSGSATWESLFVPFRLPPEASDHARTQRLLATHLLVPLERYSMDIRWWVRETGEGLDRGIPFDVANAPLQALRLKLWAYYSRHAISAGERELATRTHRLATTLSTQGYFVDQDGLRTLSISLPGEDRWFHGDLGFPNPFLLNDNWMTPWSDFPPAVRAAVLAVIPEEELAWCMVRRIFHEMGKAENHLAGRYHPIAGDTWNLPATLRDRVFDLIPKPVQPLWSHWVADHDPARPLAEHSATIFLGPEPPPLDTDKEY